MWWNLWGIPLSAMVHRSNLINDIETAVANAANGTTLIFKAGSDNTFTAPLTINKPLTLKGRDATIAFALPKSAFIMLKIYNLLGEEVATLLAEQRAAGIPKLNWVARGMASGVYLYRLEEGSFKQSKKLILMR